MQRAVADSQIDCNSIQKKCLLLEISTIIKFLLFMMNYFNDGVVYLIIDIYNFFIILMCK